MANQHKEHNVVKEIQWVTITRGVYTI